jgi:hypothetical protein
LLPAGGRVLAAVNSELAGWLDGQAIDMDPQHSRNLAEQLRVISRCID